MKISIISALLCTFAFSANAGFPCVACGNTVTKTTAAEAGAQSSTFTDNGNANTNFFDYASGNATAVISATNSELSGEVQALAHCPSGQFNCPAVNAPKSLITGHLWDTVHFLTPGVAFVRVFYTVSFTNYGQCYSCDPNYYDLTGTLQVNSNSFARNTSTPGTCCSSAVLPVGPQMTLELQIHGAAYAAAGGYNMPAGFTDGGVSAGVSFVALDSTQTPLSNVDYTTISNLPQAIVNGTWKPLPVATVPWNEPPLPELTADHGVIGTATVHSPSNRLYVTLSGPSPHVEVLDLLSLAAAGEIPGVNANGVVVSSQSQHGFSSSNPVAMWDAKSLRVLRTIPLAGKGIPGAIVLDTQNDLVYLFHQGALLATILSASDGSTVAQITLDGIVKEAVTDGQGHVYAGLENSGGYSVDILGIAVNGTPGVTGRWMLSGGGSCSGLAMDGVNGILFATCGPLSATSGPVQWMAFQSGRIIPTSIVPVFSRAKAAVFNPDTQEVFSLQVDGTMTIIQEQNPTSFTVENLIQASPIPPTSLALDSRTGRLYLTGKQSPSSEGAGGGLFILGKDQGQSTCVAAQCGKPDWVFCPLCPAHWVPPSGLGLHAISGK